MTTPNESESQIAEASLFEGLPSPSAEQVQDAQAKAAAKQRNAQPRLREPNRLQIELRASDLESLLAADHRARLVWGYVVRQDLSKQLDAIKARGSNAGRAAIDPRILFALWLCAKLEGVGSGREVARLTQEHDAYRWICGGVSVNHHALNDFHSGNEALMDELLTDNVAALAAAGAISLERVAQTAARARRRWRSLVSSQGNLAGTSERGRRVGPHPQGIGSERPRPGQTARTHRQTARGQGARRTHPPGAGATT